MTADGKSWLKALPFKIFVLAAAYFIVGIQTASSIRCMTTRLPQASSCFGSITPRSNPMSVHC